VPKLAAFRPLKARVVGTACKPTSEHRKIHARLLELSPYYRGGIIPFPRFRELLGQYLKLTKSQSWAFAKELERLGLAEFIPYHGIKPLRKREVERK